MLLCTWLHECWGLARVLEELFVKFEEGLPYDTIVSTEGGPSQYPFHERLTDLLEISVG